MASASSILEYYYKQYVLIIFEFLFEKKAMLREEGSNGSKTNMSLRNNEL